jgi:PEP-CTERM motif
MRKRLIVSCAATLVMVAVSTSAQADTMWLTGNDGSSLINFDTVTGATNFIGNFTTSGTYGLAFAPDGAAYTLRGSQATLATVNLSNGALTTVGGPAGFFGYALDFANDGTLYGVNVNTNQIYSINTTTGAFSFVASLTGPATGIMDITFDQSGNLYGVGPSNNLVYSINVATGASSLAFTTVLGNLMGIAADNAGNLIAVSYTNPSVFERINTSNGTSVIVGAIGGFFDHGGDIQLTAVPEPSSLLLLGSGLVAAGRFVRRKLGD